MRLVVLALFALVSMWNSFSSAATVSCTPFAPCACKHNAQGIDAIKCKRTDTKVVVYCFPQTINFAFNQTGAISCDEVSASEALQNPGSLGGTIKCHPFSPCNGCGTNDQGIDAIKCKSPTNTVITCFPKTISFQFNQTSTIDCTTVW